MKNPLENGKPDKLLHLIDPRIVELNGNKVDFPEKIHFRLGGSSAPPTLFYRVEKPNLMARVMESKRKESGSRVTHDDSDGKDFLIEKVSMEWVGPLPGATLKPMHWEERRKGWSVVDKDKSMDYFRKEARRSYEEERQRKKTITNINRRSMKEDIAGRKREKVRKMSQRKWKWFYQGKQSRSNDSSSQINDKSNQEKDEDEAHAEVMAWLMELDFNELPQTELDL